MVTLPLVVLVDQYPAIEVEKAAITGNDCGEILISPHDFPDGFTAPSRRGFMISAAGRQQMHSWDRNLRSAWIHAFAGLEPGTRPNNCACSCRAAATSRLVASSIDDLIRVMNSRRDRSGGNGSRNSTTSVPG